MAGTKKISELDSLTSPNDADLLVTVSYDVNYKITKANFLGSSGNQKFTYETSVLFGLNNVTYTQNGTALGIGNRCQVMYGGEEDRQTAVGYGNLAVGVMPTAVGSNNTASGYAATAVGSNNTASGNYLSVAMGFQNTASAVYSTSVGCLNTAISYGASTFGFENVAYSRSSTAIGNKNESAGDYSTALGYENVAYGWSDVAIGSHNAAYDGCSIAIGYNNDATEYCATAIGSNNTASGEYSVACGIYNDADSDNALAFGYGNDATDNYTMALGFGNNATNNYASAVGYQNTASGRYSLALGHQNTASGRYALAMGHGNYATGYQSIAIGGEGFADGDYSVAIGGGETEADGDYSVAIGYQARARVNGTVNIAGPIIVRAFDGSDDDDEVDTYAGVQNVIMSPEMDFVELYPTSPMNSVYKFLPENSSFFVDEVGLIVTDANNVAYGPVFALGSEQGAVVEVERLQWASAGGTGFSIDVSWDEPTTEGSTLVFVAVAYGTDYITCGTLGNGSPNRDYMSTPVDRGAGDNTAGLTIAVFTVGVANSDSGAVTFITSVSTDIIGFIYEISGLSGYQPYSNATVSFDETNTPVTASINTEPSNYNPSSLLLAVMAQNSGGAFSDPQNGFSVFSDELQGGFHAAVLGSTISGPGSISTGISSTDSTPWVSVMVGLKASLLPGNDLFAPSESPERMTAPMEKHRFRVTDELANNNGHTILTATLVTPAEVNETGYMRGRFYWKGILVEDQ
jgi:hypothetical protein